MIRNQPHGEQSYMKTNRLIVAVMVLFAVLLVTGGLVAFVAAPPEANPKTALNIPGTCATIMLLAAGVTYLGVKRPSPRMAMIGGHVGMVLPFLFALLFLPPALARTKANANFSEAKAAYDRAVGEGRTFATEDEREAFFRERKSPDHDQTYLVVTLWSLIALSGAAGVTLIALGLRSRREALAARAVESRP